MPFVTSKPFKAEFVIFSSTSRVAANLVRGHLAKLLSNLPRGRSAKAVTSKTVDGKSNVHLVVGWDMSGKEMLPILEAVCAFIVTIVPRIEEARVARIEPLRVSLFDGSATPVQRGRPPRVLGAV